MPSIHSRSEVNSQRIGEDTRIDAFAVVQAGAVIGAGCHLAAHTYVDHQVIVGDHVTLGPGACLCNGTELGNEVHVGPNVTFQEKDARTVGELSSPGEITLCRDGVSIGAGATILPGVVIGERAVVGAGAFLARSVPPNAIVVGNPARIVGYVDAASAAPAAPAVSREGGGIGAANTRVEGVKLHRMPYIRDMRGDLTVGEFGRSVPFLPKRYFLVLGVPDAELRGEHAHRRCHQFLVCVAGSIAVVADDGCNRQEFLLDRPDIGLYLPAMTWGIQYKYTQDAVLAVFASEFYDERDYIRDYAQFMELKAARGQDALHCATGPDSNKEG
jgi:UDP-2-acetamido-3-amino-2,3-dideoxy-glucuronate N-acetyltransferase